MANPPDISQILATLGQRPNGALAYPPPMPPQQHYNPQSHMSRPPPMPPQYAMPPHAAPSYPMPSQAAPPVPFPRPSGSGTINMYDVRPVNSGTLNMNHAPPAGYNAYPPMARAGYRMSRSRSRSPRRSPDHSRGMPNPYRDERRPDPHSVHLRDQSPGNRYNSAAGRSAHGQPDRASGEKSTETVMIDSSVVGLIIGRQGENMRHIESETQTRIQFDKAGESNGPMRKCTITGTKPARDHAVSEINRIIEENEKTGKIGSGRAPPASDNVPAANGAGGETIIMVPSKTVGLVIGKGGETIKEVQDRSQCHVNIMPEEQTVNGLRPVHLLGNAQQAAMAKDIIMEIVNTDVKKIPNAAGVRDGVNAAPLGARGGNEKITTGIKVPSEAVGMIIGKGGETVRDMQTNTGCKVNVFQPSGRDIEREIELIGTHSAIDHARALIMDKVRAVQEKNSRGSGPPVRDDGMYSQYQNPGPPKQAPYQPYHQEVGEPPGGHEAYAAYGGYQNYVALWYASNQGKQQDPSGAPPGSAQYP